VLTVRGVVYIPANVTVTQDALYTTFDAASPHETASIYTTAGTVVTYTPTTVTTTVSTPIATTPRDFGG